MTFDEVADFSELVGGIVAGCLASMVIGLDHALGVGVVVDPHVQSSQVPSCELLIICGLPLGSNYYP